MKGLAPQTSEIFEKISRLECIKPFVLVGGTALSLQFSNRYIQEYIEEKLLELKQE